MTEATREQILKSIEPKSDQFNYDDLIGGPITVKIAGVSAGTTEQPLNIRLEGETRFYRPSKSMRRVLVFLWGNDGHAWVGRSMTLYGDPNVMFGGVKVGGIKISHMTDVAEVTQMPLTASKGKKALHTVSPLAVQTNAKEPSNIAIDADLENGLLGAASEGTLAYQRAWESLSAAERKTTGANGHAKFKRIAANADLPEPLRENLDAGGYPLHETSAG